MGLELELSDAINSNDKGSFLVTTEKLWSMDYDELKYAEGIIQQLPKMFPNYIFYVQDDFKSGGLLFGWERNDEHGNDQRRLEKGIQSTELVRKS